MKKFLVIALVAMTLLVGFAAAERLPPATPENQVLSATEIIQVLGPVIKDVNLVNEHSNLWLHNDIMGPAETVSRMSYKYGLITNGGLTDSVYTLKYSSANKALDQYNLDTDSVVTYQTDGLGSTLAMNEKVTIDVAGNYSMTGGNMRCVFASASRPIIPAFCNVVSAESKLTGVTSMAFQTDVEARDTAASADTPMELNYNINVDPNASTGSEDADGSVMVKLSASIMEGNGAVANVLTGQGFIFDRPNQLPGNRIGTWDNVARKTTYTDKVTVTGGITKLQKSFSYKGGMRL